MKVLKKVIPKVQNPFAREKEDAEKKPMPPFLRTRYIKLIVSGVGGWACSTLLFILFSDSLKAAMPLIASFSVVAGVIVIMAILFRRAVMTNGFSVIDGKVCYIKYGIRPGIRRNIIAYHIKTKDGVYEIPAFKGTPEAGEESPMRIYTSASPQITDRSGLKVVDPFWGYELLGEESSEEV